MKDRVRSYLLAQLYAEVCERDRQSVDPLSKAIYDRFRELYWTVSRILRQGRKLLGWREESYKPPLWMLVDESVVHDTSRGRVLIDTTPTARRDIGTGIQRVVRQIVKAAIESGEGFPVMIIDGRLCFYAKDAAEPIPLDIRTGDTLLLLDSGWLCVSEYRPIVDLVRAHGGRNVVCLYDLFPIIYGAAFPKALRENFRKWFEEIILSADGVAAISRSVANEFEQYCHERHIARKEGQKLGAWALGADFAETASAPATPRVGAIVEGRCPFFLAVGTLAPNKGQALCLSAFEELWTRGVDVALVIVGRPGWNTTALERRLREHPERGRRLFWLSDACDAELQCLYRSARAVICASYAEGFGLPLIEAAHAGAPVIASDIEIFHEVGGDSIAYFDVLDSQALAERIVEMLASEKRAQPLPVLSWNESMQALFDLVKASR
ncbi:glycosyltransferase family 1 protein [Methylocystis sp.]|uniref:glycosyltransferase family 4 protein n=1 Tax=Methylocystis sp. TaxID=1911079 RepID=UPI0025E05184|nr:glycosyltransferase family 1 protein [Methylocystis sp.]